MKKRVFRRISLLLAALLTVGSVSCSGGSEPAGGESTDHSPDNGAEAPANPDAPAENADSSDPAETEWPAPDYSDFTMPGETGELVVYADAAMGRSVMNPAVRIFEELYPGIRVDYKTMSEDDFEALIRTEIPAGRGPDLLLFTVTDIPDVYKTASTGLFTDLNPYFLRDEEIDLDEFIVPVMDGGVLTGQRFFAPINYEMPLLVTARSTLDEIGMTEEEIKTSDGFLEAAARFHEKHPTSTLFIDTFGGPREISDIHNLYNNFGFNLIDYQTMEVGFDEEMFRRCVDTVKLYYNPDYDPNDTSLVEESDGWYNSGWAIHTKHCLFDHVGTALMLTDQTSWRLTEAGDEMVLFAQRNQRNGVTAVMVMNTAIPTGAKNKLNGWRLLKILLSDEIQGGHDETRWDLPYFWVGFPVRRDSLRDYIWMDGMEEDEAFRQYMEVVQSPTEALMLPPIIKRYINLEILPYVRSEKSWDDCFARFVNTLELYASE